MRTLLCLALLTAALCRGAAPAIDQSELPLEVKYSPASPQVVATASVRLMPALTDSAALAALLAPDNDETVKVGPFFGIEIEGDGLDGRQIFGKGRYRLPESEEMPAVIVDSFGAQSRPQKLMLAHYLTLAANFSGKVTIREPNFEELALVWAWIDYDLDGPLLVAESAHDKYFFDFDPSGSRITWIERLSRPCFTASQEGNQVLTCTCARIDRNEREWHLGYQVLESCPATGLHQVSLVAQASGNSKLVKLPAAYVRVSDKSARVDALTIRQFADAYAVTAVDAAAPGYRGLGKMLEGKRPEAPKDEHGKPVRAYVLLGTAVGPDGRMGANRILLSTDERASAAVLEAAKTWRMEPATLDGKAVTEIFWHEIPL